MRSKRDISDSDNESVLSMSLSSDCLSEEGSMSPAGSDQISWGNKKADFYGGSEDESDNEVDNMKSREALPSTSDCLDLWNALTDEKDLCADTPQRDIAFAAHAISPDRKSSELKALINQLLTSSTELHSKLLPLRESLQIIPDQNRSTVMSFIETKVQLLLNYLVNLSFYSVLKAKGLQIKDHPVIQQLTKVKTLLEKLQPVEAKLKSRIETMLAETISGGRSSLMPCVASFVDIDHVGSDDTRPKAKRSRVSPTDTKFSSAELEALSYYRAEFSDKPQLIGSSHQGVDLNLSKSLIQKQEFEEENFIRLPVAKKEKQLAKKLGKKTAFALAGVDDIDELADFGSSIAGNHQEDNLKDYMNSAKQLTSKRVSRAADEYVDFKHARGSKAADIADVSQRISHETFDHDLIVQAKTARTARIEEKRSGRKAADLVRLPAVQEEVSGVRTAGFDIEKNKGLIRKRKKEDRNARVKNRNKFEKAVKRRKGQVQDSIRHGDDHGGKDYSGEQTGLKAYVKKSTKIT